MSQEKKFPEEQAAAVVDATAAKILAVEAATIILAMEEATAETPATEEATTAVFPAAAVGKKTMIEATLAAETSIVNED